VLLAIADEKKIIIIYYKKKCLLTMNLHNLYNHQTGLRISAHCITIALLLLLR